MGDCSKSAKKWGWSVCFECTQCHVKPWPILWQFLQFAKGRQIYIRVLVSTLEQPGHGEPPLPLSLWSETWLLRAVHPKRACLKSLGSSTRARAKLQRSVSQSCLFLATRPCSLPDGLPTADEPPAYFLSCHISGLCHLNHSNGHFSSSD